MKKLLIASMLLTGVAAIHATTSNAEAQVNGTAISESQFTVRDTLPGDTTTMPQDTTVIDDSTSHL